MYTYMCIYIYIYIYIHMIWGARGAPSQATARRPGPCKTWLVSLGMLSLTMVLYLSFWFSSTYWSLANMLTIINHGAIVVVFSYC